MKAMILAAGLGTRLRPITDSLPKALAPAGGVPLLRLTLDQLRRHGFNRVIINVHHFADQVIRYVESLNIPGMQLYISDESDFLLDTGGGIGRAAWFLDGDESFLVYNVDIVTDSDLTAMFREHERCGALATLLTSTRPSGRRLLFDEQGRLCGWENTGTGTRKVAWNPERPPVSLAFSGIHVIRPELFRLIEETGAFSILDVYLRLAATHPILAYIDDRSLWIDAGTPAELERAGRLPGNRAR
jgi:N-acetyl-alpha-D-muramate 1-phosphate uridylyltransferase